MGQSNTESRFLKFHEIRQVEDDQGGKKISGYAALFNVLSPVMYGFREKIAKGAFSQSLIDNDVRALWSHDTAKPLGRTGNETLTLSEDDKGLKFELKLPENSWGVDAYEAISRGDVSGMSFGFRVIEDEWIRGEGDDLHTRVLLTLDLMEVSPVAFPAYPDTDVSARSAQDLLKKIEEEWAYRDNCDDSNHVSKHVARCRLLEIESEL